MKTIYNDNNRLNGATRRIELYDAEATAISVGDTESQPSVYVREYDEDNQLTVDYVIFGADSDDINDAETLWNMETASTHDEDIATVRYID